MDTFAKNSIKLNVTAARTNWVQPTVPLVRDTAAEEAVNNKLHVQKSENRKMKTHKRSMCTRPWLADDTAARLTSQSTV
jgi:hypothetical protein